MTYLLRPFRHTVYDDFWTPDVAGYQHLWDLSDGSEVTESSGVVSTLGDKGSGANDLTQSITPRKPTGYGSTGLGTTYRLEAAVFDGNGTDGDVLRTTSTTTLSSAFSMVIALKMNSGSGADVIIEHGSNYNTDKGFILYYDHSTTRLYFSVLRGTTYTSKYYTTTLTSAGTVIAFKADGTEAGHKLWRDGSALSGTTAVSGDPGTSDTTKTLFLGRRDADSTLAAPMNFGTLVYYDSTLSDANMVTLSDSLAAHWGI